MIEQKELNQIANRARVLDKQVEKDYVISWILAGIAQDETLKKHLCMKGGTLLKKCYFNDYRFSEDLDFTMINGGISETDIKNGFLRVGEFVREESGNNVSLKVKVETNQHGNMGFKIEYISVLGGFGANKEVFFDISTTEKMVSPVEEKEVFVNYSDQPRCKIFCYSLEEVLSEKMCALMSREQPRDLYDFWYLLEIHGLSITDYYNSFSEKAKHKRLEPTDFLDKVEKRMPKFKEQWIGRLKNQIHLDRIPNFSDVERELGRHFRIFDEYLQKQKIQPQQSHQFSTKKRGRGM
jgi:predicted nucleotidyltransferase component of viral defense system